MCHTTLFDQNKLCFQKLDSIMIPELVLKLPNVLIIIDSLRFHFKVDLQVAFFKKNFIELSRFEYFFLVVFETFYIPIVDYMYDWIFKVVLANNLNISWVVGHLKNVLRTMVND